MLGLTKNSHKGWSSRYWSGQDWDLNWETRTEYVMAVDKVVVWGSPCSHNIRGHLDTCLHIGTLVRGEDLPVTSKATIRRHDSSLVLMRRRWYLITLNYLKIASTPIRKKHYTLHPGICINPQLQTATQKAHCRCTRRRHSMYLQWRNRSWYHTCSQLGCGNRPCCSPLRGKWGEIYQTGLGSRSEATTRGTLVTEWEHSGMEITYYWSAFPFFASFVTYALSDLFAPVSFLPLKISIPVECAQYA